MFLLSCLSNMINDSASRWVGGLFFTFYFLFLFYFILFFFLNKKQIDRQKQPLESLTILKDSCKIFLKLYSYN